MTKKKLKLKIFSFPWYNITSIPSAATRAIIATTGMMCFILLILKQPIKYYTSNIIDALLKKIRYEKNYAIPVPCF